MIPQRWVILALILLAQTVADVGPLGIPAIASLIRADLGLTPTQAGSFISAYDIGPILMSLPAGTMADHWGIARTLILGQVVVATGLLAVSASGSYAVPIVVMVCAGFGYGLTSDLWPLIFGACVEAIGGYRGPWVGLALTMIGGLALLALVRERPRADVFVG